MIFNLMQSQLSISAIMSYSPEVQKQSFHIHSVPHCLRTERDLKLSIKWKSGVNFSFSPGLPQSKIAQVL